MARYHGHHTRTHWHWKVDLDVAGQDNSFVITDIKVRLGRGDRPACQLLEYMSCECDLTAAHKSLAGTMIVPEPTSDGLKVVWNATFSAPSHNFTHPSDTVGCDNLQPKGFYKDCRHCVARDR